MSPSRVVRRKAMRRFPGCGSGMVPPLRGELLQGPSRIERSEREKGTTMKHLLHTFNAFALCCVVSVAAHAEEEDGNFLLRECKETLTATYQECSAAVSGMHCLGFIDGLVDMNNIYKATVLKGTSPALICLPQDKHLTTGQLVRVVVEYLEH